MSSNPVKKNKFIEYNAQYDIDSDEEENYHEDELQDQEYYEDTVKIIKKSLVKFVSEKSLTLCEYMNENVISNFCSRNLNF